MAGSWDRRVPWAAWWRRRSTLALLLLLLALVTAARGTTASAAKWKSAPACCPGCSYGAATCCCPPLSPRTKTVTTTARAKLGHRRSWFDASRHQNLDSAFDSYYVEFTRSRSEVSGPDGVGLPSRYANLRALVSGGKHLCPACPSGVKVLPAGSRTNPFLSYSFCCPPRKTVTRTVTKKPTPTVIAQVWYDNNLDGKPKGKSDAPYAGQRLLLLRPDGSVFAQVKLGNDGKIRFTPKTTEPFRGLTVVPASNRNLRLANLVLDATGSGVVEVPIPPKSPVISGKIWFDNDKGKTFNSPDRPLAGREAIVFLANGTEYYRTKLDSDGELRFVPKVPCPSCPLRIALASNPTEKLQTFYTDSEGNARFDVPIPPKLPVISGKVWFDTDNDKAVTSGDVPLAGKKMLLVMANGTVYHQTTLDADGSFVYPPTSGSPNLPLKLVDAAIPSKVYGTFRTDLEGNGRIDVPIPPTPVVAGRVWLDNDKNDKAAGTSDVDLAGEPINLLRPDDTIFMSSTLDARGSFVYNPPVAEPNLRLRIVLAAEPKKTLALLLTDAKGNGRVDVPIPPVLPTVSGQIWWDNDDNKAMSSGDQPLRGEPVVLLRPDGSIFCSTSLGIDGSMTYFPDKAEPNLRLTVVLVSDPTRVLGGLTTDPAGNGRFDIPIPPPNNPVAQTSIATATTTPLASAPPPATSSNVPVPITTNKAPIFVPTTAPLPIQMTTKAPVPVPTTAPLLVRTTAKAALTTAKLVVPQTTAKAILTTSKTVLTTKKINALTVSLPRGTSTKIRTTSTTTTTRVAGAAISGFVFTDDNQRYAPYDPNYCTLWANGSVVIKASNGSTVATVPTDASGNFEWVPVDPLPNENLTFTILGRESEIMGQVVTNSTGGASDVQIMVPVTILAFKVFSDYNGNGVLDLGEPILRELPYTVAFDNGTVVANDSIPSGQDWGTWWEPVFYPDTNFTVALAIDPGSLLCSVKTNSTAYGSKICPVPPSQISGNVWSDDLCDGTFGFGDTIYSNALLYVYSLPGNTQLGNTTTNSIGSFTFQFLWPLRNKQVKVVLASDSTKSISVTLDGSGNAQNVSVQLVSSGVRGKYFVDVDQDNTYGSNDVPYASVAIDVKFSNGALLGSATTDVNSNFLVNVSNPLPSGTVLSVYTAANPSSAIGTITTDTSGFGCSVIAGPSPPGSGLVKVGNSAFDTSQTICQGSNFTAVITDSVLPGSGQRMLSANFAGATGSACYRKGTAVGPPGWTVEYSTDNGATWSATEPATGCAVTTVRTSAVQNYSGTAGTSSDMIVQKLEVSQLNYMGWLSSPSGTDGNDIIFDTANDRIFTVQHHVDYLKVVCWYKLTGQLCAGWNPAPTWTSTNFGYNVAFSRFVSGTVYNGKLYVWGRLQASNNPAVFCVDISSATPALCATKHYSLAPTLSYSNDEATSAGIRLGNRILTLTFSPKVTLICFDLSTLAPCTGTNKDLTGTGGSSGYYSAHIMAIDSTRIFAHTDSTLYCYFATNLTLCAGWPKSKSALGGTWPTSKLNKFPLVHTDATGKPDGICLEPGCLDLTGVAKATWPSPWNASSFSSAYPTVPINPDKFDLTMGFSSSWGSRVFFYYPNDWSRNAPFFCWDYATSSECLNFQYTAGSMLYFSRPDPEDPQCIWWASDPGKLGSFNALTGDPCARIVANVNPVSSYTGCSGRQVVVGPKYMTVKSIGGTNGPKNLTLTVLKADGTPVPGWIKVPMYVGVPLDTMALTPAVTGLNPTFQIMMGYIANIQTANVTYMEVETGTIVRAPEFCVGGVVTGTGSVGLPGALNQTISGSTISKPIYTNLTSVPAGTAGCNAAASTPSAPTNVVRTVSGSTVVVSFTIPTSDGGSPITAYEASGDGGTTWYPISVRCAPAPSSTCSADFNAASIKVRAVNLAGAGTASAAAS